MPVRVHLHPTHRRFAGGKSEVMVEGATVGACLEALIEQFPALRDVLFDGPVRLQRNIEIYLNMESAYPDELRKPTSDGDRIHVTLMLAGG